MGRTSRRKRSLLGRTRAGGLGGDDRPDEEDDVAEPEPVVAEPEPVVAEPVAPQPGSVVAEPDAAFPTITPIDAPTEEPLAGARPDLVGPIGPTDEPLAVPRGVLPEPELPDDPSTEEAPPRRAPPRPEVRFVPRREMLRGHVREPVPDPLLSDRELQLAAGFIALAAGFVLTGGGGLIGLWIVFGGAPFRALLTSLFGGGAGASLSG